MSTNQAREDIGRRLGAVRSSIRRAQLQRGGLLLATVALGGLLAIMAADHFLAPLPVAARWAMFGLWLAATGAALVIGMRPLLRKIGLVQVARWIEGRHPEIEERMSTVLELSGSDSGASLELLDELAKAAGEDVGKVDARAEMKAVGAGRRWARPALVLALLFAALFVIWPKEAARLAVRAVAPFSNLGNAAAVKFEVKPGDIELLEGDALAIAIAYAGPADALDLAMTMAGGNELTQPMNREGDFWSYRMDPVREGFVYRARAGRGESDAFTVTMWPLPGIGEPRVKRTFPEYAGLLPTEEALGTGVEAVRGTKVELAGVLNTAVEAAWLEIEGTRVAEGGVEHSASGGRVSFSWTLAADGGGEAVVTLKHRLGREVEALRFPVRVLEDQLPVVRWLNPIARELRVRPDEVLGLRYEVAEDFGVAEAGLEVKTAGQETKQIAQDVPAKLPGSARPARYRGAGELAIGALVEAWPGANEVRLRVRAADARPAELDGPGVGYSEWLLIRIDRNAESLARQEMRAEHEEARETIEQAIRATQEARQKIDQSGWEMKNEQLSKEAEKNFEEAREKLADTQEKLENLAGRMEESVHAAKADDVKEAAEQVEQARQELESAPLQDGQEQREEKLDQARAEAEAAVKKLEEVRNEMDRDRQKIEELARFQELAQQQQELARQAEQQAKQQAEQQATAQQESELPQDWQDRQQAMEEALRQQLREQPQARAEVLEDQAKEAQALAEQARELSEAQKALEEQTRQMPVADQAAPDAPPEAAVDSLREALAKEQAKIAEAAAEQLAEARQERSEVADLLPEAVAATREASEQLSKGEDQAAAEAAREAVEALKESVSPPEAGEPEAGQPEAGQPEVGMPEAGQPEAGQPEAGQPEAGQPEAGQPEAGQPEAGQPEAGQPEAGQPEAGQPEAGQPEAGQPEAGQPEAGQPEAGQPEMGQAPQGEAPAGQSGESPAQQAERKAEVEALAERQQDVAEALEALAAGNPAEALQALQEMQAGEVGELAEAIAEMPQAEASGSMNEAANAAQQGSQQAQAAAESGNQGKPQDAAGQHQQSSANLAQSAEALGRAAQEFAQAAEQARGQQADPNRAPLSPGDLAEAFQAASRAEGEAQAAQAAGQAQQAAAAMARAARSARQSMQGRAQPGQPGQPGQPAPPGQPGNQPGQQPDEGPRSRQADPGVPPELAKLGISAADWEKIQATLKSDVGDGGGAGVPEEYRGLVKKYFEAMTEE